MNREEKSRIVDAIREAARVRGVKPHQLTRDDFLKLSGMRERQIRAMGGWFAAKEIASQTPDALEGYRMREKMRDLRLQNEALLERLDESEARAGAREDIEAHEPDVCISPRERGGVREATAFAAFSDTHFEETVEGDTINDVNAYDLHVAERRTEKYYNGVCDLLDYHSRHFAIRDLVHWLGGDLITGYIHEELVEGNGLSPTYATAFARMLIKSGIQMIRERFPLLRIIVPCNHGNHGRTTEKRRVATAAANSYEHFLYHMLRDDFQDDDNVVFQIARGAHLYVGVYDYTLRLHHGDEVRYQGGIGGISIPLNKAVHAWNTVKHADMTVIGHYHQYSPGQRIVTNGSLIGYNPFALSVKATFEPPQQAFFLIDSKRGPCMHTPIWCDSDDQPDAAKSAAIKAKVRS